MLKLTHRITISTKNKVILFTSYQLKYYIASTDTYISDDYCSQRRDFTNKPRWYFEQ